MSSDAKSDPTARRWRITHHAVIQFANRVDGRQFAENDYIAPLTWKYYVGRILDHLRRAIEIPSAQAHRLFGKIHGRGKAIDIYTDDNGICFYVIRDTLVTVVVLDEANLATLEAIMKCRSSEPPQDLPERIQRGFHILHVAGSDEEIRNKSDAIARWIGSYLEEYEASPLILSDASLQLGTALSRHMNASQYRLEEFIREDDIGVSPKTSSLIRGLLGRSHPQGEHEYLICTTGVFRNTMERFRRLYKTRPVGYGTEIDGHLVEYDKSPTTRQLIVRTLRLV